MLVANVKPLYWAIWPRWWMDLSWSRALDNFFGLFRPYQHGLACKQAQVPKTNITNCKSAMLVGCGHKDEHKRASS